MHVIVCIKQVPDTTNVRINPKTNTLMREGVESILNPFDEFALEEGLRLHDQGAKLSVISMGPPQAIGMLRDAIARGADEAFLLSDRAFAGADTLATGYALSCAIRKICEKPDLILFGKQAIDGDTAQVGPGVSEVLGIPLVTYVKDLAVKADGTFTATTVMDFGDEYREGRLPAVMTVLKEAHTPRFAPLAGAIAARAGKVTVWSAKDVGADPERIGLNGSPTKVVRIFPPPTKGGGAKVDARGDAAKGAAAVVELLAKKGLLK